MGQRKIEIAKIVDPKKRIVTFSKRRDGIKNKATELCRLFADIIVCIIVFSPGGRAYTFTNSPVGVCNMVQRFLEEQKKGKKQESENVHRSKNSTQCRNKAGTVGNGSTDSFWWDNIDNEELNSVEKLKSVRQSLEKLKQNLCARKQELIASSSASSSSTIENLFIDEDCIIEDRIVEDAAASITQKHEARRHVAKIRLILI
ncbi:hypothetical protein MKW92_004521 [Papaver armeniacum]|nr:hypothetical protein MKW92_004521 [Papaver armeniacum]